MQYQQQRCSSSGGAFNNAPKVDWAARRFTRLVHIIDYAAHFYLKPGHNVVNYRGHCEVTEVLFTAAALTSLLQTRWT